MSANKISVRIYGQEYTISGDRAGDEIRRAAYHVDRKMNDLSAHAEGGSITSLAVLAALNIADEYETFKVRSGVPDGDIDKLKSDLQHSRQLLDKTKEDFQKFRKDAREAFEKQERERIKLQESINHSSSPISDEEFAELKEKLAEAEKLIEEKDDSLADLNSRIAEMEAETKEEDSGSSEIREQLRELEDRYKEVEGSYFEVQMENIRLKGELDRYREEDI